MMRTDAEKYGKLPRMPIRYDNDTDTDTDTDTETEKEKEKEKEKISPLYPPRGVGWGGKGFKPKQKQNLIFCVRLRPSDKFASIRKMILGMKRGACVRE